MARRKEAPLFSSGELSLEDVSGPKIDRRTTIKLLSAAGITGLAGCTGGGDGDDGGDDTTTTADDSGGDGGGGGDGGDGGDDDSDDGDGGGSDRYGGRLQYGVSRDETGRLEPGFITSTQSIQILNNTHSALVQINEDLTLSGDLAKDWTVEDGGSRVVFDLREDVTFHGGNEFTASDVVWTFTRYMEEEAPTAIDQMIGVIKPPEDDGIVAVDDYTVEFNFVEPLAAGLVYLEGQSNAGALILDEAAFNEMGQDAYGMEPTGTGPFAITEHQLDSVLTLDRHDDYHHTDEDGNQLPYLDGVDIHLVPENAAAMNGLQTDEIDTIDTLRPSMIPQIAGIDDLVMEQVVNLQTRAIGLNNNKAPFDDVKFRMACAKAINNEEVIQDAFFGTGEPARGDFSPAIGWLYREDQPDPQAYDIEEAKRLLEESSWDGESMEYISWPGKERLGIVLRQQLRELGVTLEVNALPSGTYLERLNAGEYDVIPYASYGDLDPDQIVSKLYHPDGSWNHWHFYTDPQLTEWIEQQRTMQDREARKEVLWQIEDHIKEAAPGIFLTHRFDIMGRHRRVQNYTHLPSRKRLDGVYLDEDA